MVNIVANVILVIGIVLAVVAIVLSIVIEVTYSKLRKIKAEEKERKESIEKAKTFEVSFNGSINYQDQEGGFNKKNFDSIDEFGNWVVEQNKRGEILEQDDLIKFNDNGVDLFVSVYNIPRRIVSIKDHRGYLYSDGSKTSDVRHCSKEIKSFIDSFKTYYEDLKSANLEFHLVD